MTPSIIHRAQVVPAHEEWTVSHCPWAKKNQIKALSPKTRRCLQQRSFPFTAHGSLPPREAAMPHLEGCAARPGVCGFPCSSADVAPLQRASVLQKAAGEIRLSRAGESCAGPSEHSSANNLVTRERSRQWVKDPEVPLDTRVFSNNGPQGPLSEPFQHHPRHVLQLLLGGCQRYPL